ncbi:MAG: hypothetical protein JHC96_17835 [Brevundimonas sp.]|uniref:hypothetical protein n=1 Tax=Brevundimonas sp. TaxID=1871086 RepID=UPI001A2EEB3E|nr:hypothetical protein [Brevundimonas sp.]MBJ7320646.1 hypothetical protein [Brevundimonas sp.]
MKSFRTPAILGAVATVLLTSGAAFAGTVPASTASAATARPAATSSARPQHQTRNARHHRAETPAKVKPAKPGRK